MTKTGNKTERPFWLLFIAILILRLMQISIVPVSTDEAYYFSWAKSLSWGYFDHPPFIAWISILQLWAPGIVAAGRIGPLVCSMVTLVVLWRLTKLVGMNDTRLRITAVLLASCNLINLVGGALATPDAPLLMWWTIALHEAAVALQKDPKRWLTAGVATGFGIISKYTMLFIGFVFLWGLISAGRRSKPVPLLRPWPYLGGFCCLIILIPHLYWQQNNQWLTFKFQFAHGFGGDGKSGAFAEYMPAPEPPKEGSDEAAMGAAFNKMKQEERKEEKKQRIYDPLLDSLNRYLGFYGAQLAFWGALLIPVLLGFSNRRDRVQFSKGMNGEIRGLIHASYGVPLIFFGLLALFRKVEANWSVMYMIGASIALSPMIWPHSLRVIAGSVANLFLLLLVILHLHLGILPVRPHHDRIRKELNGYKQLSEITNKLSGYVFVDTYQTKAMLDFYGSRPVFQYPHLTRPSEYVTNPFFHQLTSQDVVSNGNFHLVTQRSIPPSIQGFIPREWKMLRYCLGTGLQEIAWSEALTRAEERCKTPIHMWFLGHYQSQTR